MRKWRRGFQWSTSFTSMAHGLHFIHFEIRMFFCASISLACSHAYLFISLSTHFVYACFVLPLALCMHWVYCTWFTQQCLKCFNQGEAARNASTWGTPSTSWKALQFWDRYPKMTKCQRIWQRWCVTALPASWQIARKGMIDCSRTGQHPRKLATSHKPFFKMKRTSQRHAFATEIVMWVYCAFFLTCFKAKASCKTLCRNCSSFSPVLPMELYRTVSGSWDVAASSILGQSSSLPLNLRGPSVQRSWCKLMLVRHGVAWTCWEWLYLPAGHVCKSV